MAGCPKAELILSENEKHQLAGSLYSASQDVTGSCIEVSDYP